MKSVLLSALLMLGAEGQSEPSPVFVEEEASSYGCVAAPFEACACDEGCGGLLGYGWLKPSDHCYDCFISPISNPVFFEDPRTLTEARLIYAHHNLPGALGGGDLDVLALQVRAALTENLSLVATKDGFVFAGSDAPLDDGWNDIAGGLKYNLYKDPELQRLLSVGLNFELPVGSTRTLQGNGDGEFLLYLTGGTQFGDASHWISATGWRLPVDGAAESESIYWSNHFDTLLWWPGVYALAEVNWFHWLDSGAGGIHGMAGYDVFNFGSTGVTDSDLVTTAFGLKYKPHGHLELGAAYEFPISDNEDVIDDRLYFDAILRY